MPQIQDLDLWLKPEDIGKESIIEIISPHRVKPKEETSFDSDVSEVTIRLPNKEERLWTMNMTSLRMVAQLYGQNSDKWVGKKVTLFTKEQNVRGKDKLVIYVKGDLVK
jgi:hypothetical protein